MLTTPAGKIITMSERSNCYVMQKMRHRNAEKSYLQSLHHGSIASLTIDQMQNTINEQVQTFYPAKDMKTVLSHCFALAIQREIVLYNKTQYLEMPPLKKIQRDASTGDEIDKIWDAWNSGKIFTGYVLIMIYAGLRYGEISTIQKSNIHLDEQYALGGIKTEAGIDREIAFADKIMPIVTYFFDRAKERLLKMPENRFYDSYHSLTSELDPQPSAALLPAHIFHPTCR